jgi:cation diffusion facilitator CzcD-associated flavoprotein CzcO
MTEHVDVLIVGAGLSGIGAACRLRQEHPGKSIAILESRGAIGGTWDLFRYPGIRSDSDMFTLGFDFSPWDSPQAIADGPSIREYVERTAAEHGVDRLIRFHHRAVHAAWSTPDARWTVTAERTDDPDAEPLTITCGLYYNCTGYYRYDEGFTPEFPGVESFEGTLIHPQHWPEDLDYAGKRIVVIGSGATAVTLLPSLAEQAEHVTMLQRSPSYILSLPGRDPIAPIAQKVLPRKAAYAAMRWGNVLRAAAVYNLSRRAPGLVKRLVKAGVARQLPDGYDVDTHFTPRYDPWDERLCLVPDGDLFRSIRHGNASIVTDHIETFTPTGIRLQSGRELEADIIVTATGLNLLLLGGLEIDIDGKRVDLSETIGYKGLALSGVPNLIVTLGYTNASWTLKADLISHWVCRLLRYMDEHGHRIAMPLAPPADEPTHPFLDLQSGYIMRAADRLPKQGDRAPWRLYQSYPRDVRLLRRGPILDEGISFPPVPAADVTERDAAPRPIAAD